MTGSTGFPGATVFVASVSQHKSTKPLMRALVAALLASSSAPAVQAANCGAAALGGGSAGPPSISATEASTTQVLEEIRRRTQVAQQQMQPTPVSDTTVAPAATGGGSAASGTAKPAGQAAQGAPAGTYKPTYKKVAMATPADTGEYSYDGGTSKITASWGQVYLDYENHTNIAPGQQENRDRDSRTAGETSGTDWTWITGHNAFQVGFFSGYQATFNTFGDTSFKSYSGQNVGFDSINRTSSKQDIEGSFLGGYMAAIRGNATFDLAFKADIFDLKQSSVLTQTNDTCGGVIPPTAIESGKASVNNYTIAADAAYRYAVSSTGWFEPTFSIRYTVTDYGSDATTLTNIGSNPLNNVFGPPGRLGLEDGTVLRLQAGIRRGEQTQLPGGGLWTIVGGAYIYSDVAITGFKFDPGPSTNNADTVLGTTVFPVDEGKVRGMGQIVSTWDYNNHWSYLLAGEIRGGEDLFGIGGRVGARYRW